MAAWCNMGPVLNNLAGTSYTISAWVKTSIVGESNQIVVASHNAYLGAGYILGVNTSAVGYTVNREKPGSIIWARGMSPPIPA